MKTRNYLLAIAMFLFAGASTMNAQVTIGGKTTPQATLDVVVSDLTDKYVPEGVIAPRLTLEQLQFKNDAYTTAQDGVIVYVDNITIGTPTPAGKTINVAVPGYYYYDGAAEAWIGFGAPTVKVIREDVATGRIFSAAELSAQHTILVRHTGTGNVTINLPDLTEAEAGKLFTISNRGAGGTMQAMISQINTSNVVVNTNLPGNVIILRTRTLVWLGMAWAEFGL